MDSNLKKILDQFERMKGQFVITESLEVERLIAIGTDDMDYYYVTYNGRKTKWNTCVGRVIQLKGKIEDKEDNHFIHLAKLNHYDQSSLYGGGNDDEKQNEILELNKEHKKEMTTLNKPDEFLTEVCWDLN